MREAKSPGRIWCSPRNGQVGLISDGRMSFRNFGLPHDENRVVQLCEENSSHLLVLLPRGLFRFEMESGSLVPLKMPPGAVDCHSFVLDSDGVVWLCTYNEVWKNEESNWTRIFTA